MSTQAIHIADGAEGFQESLAERMARGPLPLVEALNHAIQIASALRHLHAHGLAYGAVSPQLILLTPKGADLKPTGCLARLGDAQVDVIAYGAVLAEMVRREVSLENGLRELREEISVLAQKCLEESPDMRQVLVSLRLLLMQTRYEAAVVRRPVLVRPTRVAATATKWQLPSLPQIPRLRLRMQLHWRPLVNLAGFALSGK